MTVATSKAKKPSKAATNDNGWLLISDEGFAAQNAGRPPEHLIKELVQNSLDAIGSGNIGNIDLTFTEHRNGILIMCSDNGCGIDNIDDLRTMFWTNKQDTHLKRGRLGRGFKECLCIAKDCTVESGHKAIRFTYENGKRVIREVKLKTKVDGTTILIVMPWDTNIIDSLISYFNTFLPPINVSIRVQNDKVIQRMAKHTIDATLTTESFVESRWVKPQYKTKVELVPVNKGESGMIYEMGIPVCSAEWDRPYHINVLQRVPMNPNRDAVMTGYSGKLHKACLPTIIKEMEAEDLRKEWVGMAAPALPEEFQREIIHRGFGENIVRSVPHIGSRRDHDADARDLGMSIVKTQHLSEGFKKIISTHVPSSAQAVHTHESERIAHAAQQEFNPADVFNKSNDPTIKLQRQYIEKAGGLKRVQAVCDFARNLCTGIMREDEGMITGVTVAILLTGQQVFGGKPAIATWSSQNVLTLGIDTPWIWEYPFSEQMFSLIVHEVAHSIALHHGDDFHKTVEKMAGRLSQYMFIHSEALKHDFGWLG